MWFALTTLVVTGTDCTDSGKSNACALIINYFLNQGQVNIFGTMYSIESWHSRS